MGSPQIRLDQLTEPTRSKAKETLSRLLAEGYDRPEALERAVAEAKEWEHSRVSNVASPHSEPRQG